VSCGSLPLISDVIVAQNSYVSNTNSSLKELFVSYAFMFQMQLLHATVIAAADLAELAAAGPVAAVVELAVPAAVGAPAVTAASAVAPVAKAQIGSHTRLLAAAVLAVAPVAGGLGLGLVLLEPEVVVPAMDAAADLVCPWICLAIY
jgi:hypothetical protein